jgi:hypothetical protein
MNRHLVTKVQKLVKSLPDQAAAFSYVLVIQPEEKELLQKKGTLYTAFNFGGLVEVDPLLVTKIVNDTLYAAYYQENTTSPIQALERAISEVRNKVTQIGAGGKKSSSDSVAFEIVTAILWGNVLYIVQYGAGGSFLIREGNLEAINTASEGHFSIASGVIKDNDVVILATNPFLEKYSPENLISNMVSISSHELPIGGAAVLLKFNVESVSTEEDFIDFGDPADFSKPASLEDISKSIEKTVSPLEGHKSLNIKLRRRRLDKKKLMKYFFPVLSVLLVGAVIFYSVRASKEEKKLRYENLFVEVATLLESSVEATEVEAYLTKIKDLKQKLQDYDNADAANYIRKLDAKIRETTKTEETVSKAFYDLKISDENALPNELVVLDNYVVGSDGASGKLYYSSIDSADFESYTREFPGITYLGYFGGDVSFKDNEGFKVVDIFNDKIMETYEESSLGLVATYLDYVYSLVGDTITKFTKDNGVLDGDSWGTVNFDTPPVSISIDGDIYILSEDGGLKRFSQGDEDDEFEIVGLDKPFNTPMQVYAGLDTEKIYVADAGNNRVVILDKEGVFERQLVADDNVWEDIRNIGVSRDEKTLFILDGTKIYKIDL